MGGPGARGLFLLFAASEPLRGNEGYAVASTFHRLRGPFQLPPEHPVPGLRTQEGQRRWAFPEEVGQCVRLAVELAGRLGRDVRVVDLNGPAVDVEQVRRWVSPETLLPLLVSPDGRRLEGIGSFVPSTLRAFLAGP